MYHKHIYILYIEKLDVFVPSDQFLPTRDWYHPTENICTLGVYILHSWVSEWPMTPVLPGMTWHLTRWLTKSTISRKIAKSQEIWISETLFRTQNSLDYKAKPVELGGSEKQWRSHKGLTKCVCGLDQLTEKTDQWLERWEQIRENMHSSFQELRQQNF